MTDKKPTAELIAELNSAAWYENAVGNEAFREMHAAAADRLAELEAELSAIKTAAANGPKRFGMVAWVDAHGNVHLESQDNIKDPCLVDADEAAAHAINMHKHGEQDAAERLAQYFSSMGMNTLAADIRLQAAHWPLPQALQPNHPATHDVQSNSSEATVCPTTEAVDEA